MLWIITQDEKAKQPLYWWESPKSDGIGSAGEWVAMKSQATRYTHEAMLEYTRDKGTLPTDFKWLCLTKRHKDALLIQSAVNPSGIALTLFEAFKEVYAEGGDTTACKQDPACRLILHQLAYLLDMTGGYDLTEYRKYVEVCEQQLAKEIPNP